MLDHLAVITPGVATRSISPENLDGAKGGGALPPLDDLAVGGFPIDPLR